MLIGNQFPRILTIFLLGLCSPIQAEDVAPPRTRDKAKQWVIEGKREVCRLLEKRRVSRVAFSNDAKTLATIDGTHLRIWDWRRRKELFDIRIPKANYPHLEFSKDGRYVTSGITKGGVVLRDLSKNAKKILLKSDRDLSGEMAFSPDSALLAAGGESEIMVWTLPGGGRPRLLTGTASKNGAFYSPRFVDERHVITGDLDGRISVWDVKSKRLKFASKVKVDSSSVPFSIDFPKGYEKKIVAALAERRVLAGGKRLACLIHVIARTIGPSAKTRSGALAPERDYEMQLTSHMIVVDIGTGKEICHTKKDDMWMFSLTVTADGRYLFVGSCRVVGTSPKNSETIESVSRSSVRIFDATTGKECYRYEVDKSTMPMASVAVTANGRYVAAESKKGVVIYRTPRAVWVKSTGQAKKNAKRGRSMK
jgi:hypothetical protein